ncbi:hypothetical protein FRB94_011080 [Tulasnella sp. JGI-2019a]|nr:hypothetical protein FRB94_011080 [Tulasnella sp. JGI-2019a]
MNFERGGTRLSLSRTLHLSPLTSLLILLPLFLYLPWWTATRYYSLPEPLTDQYDILTGLPQISETSILHHARYLSENIGYRTVGTREHALGDKYVLDEANKIKDACEDILRMAPTRKLQCEVWRQEGSGTHRFDMMGKRVYKQYEKLSNIILRVSDGTREGKAHALLLNSHVDSTVPSPGAADDAMCVGIMLEIARVLVHTPDWEPRHAIVFLFNNAEESLQDGSHLFATQSPVADSIRAFINLEAAGTTGPEVLFQATSEEMIEAYSHVPRPFGTVLANDVFQSGIILSDTDFRQFEEYGNLTGLDMALVGDSYLYHTRKDLVKNIQRGAAQHFAENVFAITNHLTSSRASPLPKLAKSFTPPNSVYFSLLGTYFVHYTTETAWTILVSIVAISVVILGLTTERTEESLRTFLMAGLGVLGSIVGAVVFASLTASIMVKVFGAGMSWYSREFSCFILYGPPAAAGALTAQYLISSRFSPFEARGFEYATFIATHFFFIITAVILQAFNLGSSCVFAVFSMGSLAALHVNTVLNAVVGGEVSDILLLSYVVAQIAPLIIGTELIVGLMTIFVPLTGRLGELAPVEHIIAVMSSVMSFFVISFLLPFAHKIRRNALLNTIFGLLVATFVIMVTFAFGVSPFDPMHQKRVFAVHFENLNTQEHHLQLASSDGASGFPAMVAGLAERFGNQYQKAVPVIMDDNNADWDVLYPFSQFLTPYKVPLHQPYGYISPFTSKFTVTARNNVFNHRTNQRSLTLVIDHPGVIWTTIAFDAHILKWSIDSAPEPYHTRHHIKEASFYGVNQWTLDLLIQLPAELVNPELKKLKINFMGLVEKRSWPGKKLNSDDSPSMEILSMIDAYMYERYGDSVDTMLVGCVGGIAEI